MFFYCQRETKFEFRVSMKEGIFKIIIFMIISLPVHPQNNNNKETKAEHSTKIQSRITSFESVLFHDFSYSSYILDFAEKKGDRYVPKKNLSIADVLVSSGTTLLMFESDDDILPLWYFDRSGERVEIQNYNTGIVLFSGGSKNNYLPVYFRSFNDDHPGFLKAHADGRIQTWRLNKGSAYSEPLYVSGVLVTGIGLGSMLWGMVSLMLKPAKPDELIHTEKYSIAETETAQKQYDDHLKLWKKNIITNEVAGFSVTAIGLSLVYWGIKLRPGGILIEKKF